MNINQPKTNPSELLRNRDSIYSSDLLICAVAYFDFFTYLCASTRDFDEICHDLKIATRPADVMLTLFCAMGLIKKEHDRYAINPVAKDYLVSEKYWSLVPYYTSLKNRPQCQEFHKVLTTDNPAGWSSKEDGQDWIEAMKDIDFADEFTAAMDSRGAYLAHSLSKVLDVSNHDLLLDIAGGSGIYACTLAIENENIKASVVEIPPVDEACRRSIAQRQMSEKVDVIAGDMFEMIPQGYDVHLFANVLHDWDYETNRKLVKMSYQAINEGGKIVIFDAHLNKEKDGPLEVAEYSCLLMHSTKGRCYSTREIEDLLLDAGFVDVKIKSVAAGRNKITAKKE